jgi:putative DNA primase/helicase
VRTEFGVQTADRIAAAPLRTLWRDRLIRGALNLIAGQPGAGKSSLTALIAAELSRQGHTLILSNAEDDPGTVTIPRLTVAGAILERIHIIPPQDVPLFPSEFEGLRYVVEQTGVAVVILDPISAHFSPESRVHHRPTLRQLADVARSSNCAIVGVHHTTKGGEVGGPNSGLLGTSRAVYVYGYDPEDEDRRALSCEKINGVDQPPALLFEHEVADYSIGEQLIEAGKLRKIRQSNGRAQRRRARRNPERDAACHAWLSEYLATGEDCARASREVYAQGEIEGYGQATLTRAKVTLQVEHFRAGGYGGEGWWTWRLPDDHPLRGAATVEQEGE